MYLPGDRSPVNVLRKGGRSPDGELALYLRAGIFFRRSQRTARGGTKGGSGRMDKPQTDKVPSETARISTISAVSRYVAAV